MPATLNEQQQWMLDGKPVIGGKVYYGEAGTDAKQLANRIDIFDNRALTGSPIANPQTTDDQGRTTLKVWVAGVYSILLDDANDVQLYREDDNGTTAETDVLPLDYLAGYDLSINATDPEHDFDIAPGEARDSTNVTDIILTETPFTKRIDASFSIGSGGGAIDAQSDPVQPDTPYFVWAIRDIVDLITDVLISESDESPSFPEGFTLKVLIGTLNTDDDSNILTLFGPAETISGVTISEGNLTGVVSINEGALGGGVDYDNFLINGAQNVAQRGTSVTETPNIDANGQPQTPDPIGSVGNVYPALDRYRLDIGGTPVSRWTVSQEITGGPAGFPFWQKWLCTTADTDDDAGDAQVVLQPIEAQNLQHLEYGTAGAQATVVSGQIIVHLDTPAAPYTIGIFVRRDDTSARSYVHEVVVAADAVFQPFSFVVDGDLTNEIDNDNGSGMEIGFTLLSGSTFETATLDAWQAGTFYTTSNQTNVASVTGNYIGWTAHKSAFGGVVSGFEHLPIDVELARCQRYFERRSYETTESEVIVTGRSQGSTSQFVIIPKTIQRAQATYSNTVFGSFEVAVGGSDGVVTGIDYNRIGIHSAELQTSNTLSSSGDAVQLRRDATDTPCFLDIDAEI